MSVINKRNYAESAPTSTPLTSANLPHSGSTRHSYRPGIGIDILISREVHSYRVGDLEPTEWEARDSVAQRSEMPIDARAILGTGINRSRTPV